MLPVPIMVGTAAMAVDTTGVKSSCLAHRVAASMYKPQKQNLTSFNLKCMKFNHSTHFPEIDLVKSKIKIKIKEHNN